MLYKMILNGNTINVGFFKENEFGSFLITEKLDSKQEYLTSCSIKLNNDLIEIINGSDYLVYEIIKDNKYVYVFSKLVNDLENVKYTTLDYLSNNDDYKVFSGFDVIDYLAKIVKLPNGNYVVSSVQDYISAIEGIVSRNGDKETLFRGHYSYNYSLVPSLYRKKKYYENEDSMYMDFKTQFYNELSHKKYIEILTTMQHYKMPTRLLDITSNPLVGLFMACDRPASYKIKGYNIGEVIIMNEDRRKIKYADSNITSLLSSLAVLETHYKQELYEKIVESIEKNDPSIYRNSGAYKRYVAEVQSELAYFDESFFRPEVLLDPIFVKVGMINERIIAQSGAFILFGLCNYITGEHKPINAITKERVFVVHKDYIMKQLQLLNINTGTMYPDKDHMSTTITKSYD